MKHTETLSVVNSHNERDPLEEVVTGVPHDLVSSTDVWFRLFFHGNIADNQIAAKPGTLRPGLLLPHRSLNIDLLPECRSSPMASHGQILGGGMHCMSLAIRRKGFLEDYRS